MESTHVCATRAIGAGLTPKRKRRTEFEASGASFRTTSFPESHRASEDLMRAGTPLRFYAMLGIGTALAYLAWLPPGIYSVDGNSMLAVSESLVTHHSFAVPPGDGIVGRH